MSEIKDKKMDKIEKWWWEWRLLVQRNGGSVTKKFIFQLAVGNTAAIYLAVGI